MELFVLKHFSANASLFAWTQNKTPIMFWNAMNPKATCQLVLLVLLECLWTCSMCLPLLLVLEFQLWAMWMCHPSVCPLAWQIMSRAGDGQWAPGGGGQATSFLPWPQSCALTQGRPPGRWFASISGEMWIKTQPSVHYTWKEWGDPYRCLLW